LDDPFNKIFFAAFRIMVFSDTLLVMFAFCIHSLTLYVKVLSIALSFSKLFAIFSLSESPDSNCFMKCSFYGSELNNYSYRSYTADPEDVQTAQ
jgi:hypothetical protein